MQSTLFEPATLYEKQLEKCKLIDDAFFSDFENHFLSLTGFPPSDPEATALIYLSRFTSPLGTMITGATGDGVCLLEFIDRRMLATQFKRLRKYLHASFQLKDHPHTTTLKNQLGEYFAGERTSFDLPLITPGTSFQQSVWKALLNIPAGETRSYLQQAKAFGDAGAVRAVAKANGDNRMAIIIPCHRVIAANGDLTGYGGGLWRKQWLLEMESGQLNSIRTNQ